MAQSRVGRRQNLSAGGRAASKAGSRASVPCCDAWLRGASVPPTGDALAALLGEVDVRRLNAIGDLVADCPSADELLRRTGGLLNGGQHRP